MVGSLPWFQLGQPTPEAKKKGVAGISNTEMIRNSQSSIAYVKGDLGKYIHKLIPIGLSDQLPLREWTGGTGQHEQVHFLSLLSAYFLHQEVLQKEERRKENVMLGYWIDQQGINVNTLNVNRSKIDDPDVSEEVPLLQCVRETRAVVGFIDLFIEYIAPLSGFSFFPTLTVPKWLSGVIRELGRQKGERQACQMIVKELNKEKDVFQHCLDWFLKLGSRETDPQRLFRFDEQETAFQGDRYKKAIRNPKGFFHRWMGDMERQEIPIDKNLSQSLVKGLRLRIIDEFVE